jgi:hypothetical protein
LKQRTYESLESQSRFAAWKWAWCDTSDVDSADGEEPKPIAAAGTLRVESRAMVVLEASAE